MRVLVGFALLGLPPTESLLLGCSETRVFRSLTRILPKAQLKQWIIKHASGANPYRVDPQWDEALDRIRFRGCRKFQCAFFAKILAERLTLISKVVGEEDRSVGYDLLVKRVNDLLHPKDGELE